MTDDSASHRVTLAVALTAALAWPVPPARAQAVYGSIAGTIEDSTGAALPGVTVTVTSAERKTTDVVVTNASGNYVKDRLLPGAYELKAEIAGYRAAIVSSVKIGIDARANIDLKLEVGRITESINVTADGQLLKADRADVATTFDRREVTELPLLDRNATKLLLLTPGTQQLPWQHAASENPQGSTQTMVNGQNFGGTGYQLDGTENRDPILGIIVINPNLESIGEVKVTSQNYDAEFGQATAGVVSVQTRSGTNDLRGSAFEFYQGDRFQARNPFSQPDTPNPDTGRILPATRRHQFGASLGGPIARNRWFFFTDYQGLRSSVGGSRRLTVPTALARGGDLSEYGIDVYDPLTGEQFAGNVIPASRLSPQAGALLARLPMPNAQGIRDNYLAQGSEAFDSNTGNVRIDGRITDRMNIFGRYSIADFTRDGPGAFGPAGGREIVSLGGTSEVTNHSLALGLDYTLDARTVLDVRFGFFQYKVDVLPFDFGATPARDAGIPGLNLDQFSSGLPRMFVEGEFGFEMGSLCNCPLAQNEKQFQLVSNLSRVLGNHTLKLGADVRRAYNLRVPSDAPRSGELRFSPERTSLEGDGGLGLASFLIGDVTRFRRYVSTTTDARERQWRHFYYLQDTWRAGSKLTVNLGVRLDVINPQTVNEPGNGGWLDLDTGEIKVGGVGGISLAGDVRNSLNWAPRVGVAYQLDPKTVVRLGYGRSYDIGVFGSTFGHTVTQNLPVLAVQELNPPSDFERVFNLEEGPAAPVFPAVPPNGRFPLPDGIFAQALPEKMRLPTVDAYNVTVQRQITDAFAVEIGYVGNKGTHVFTGDGSGVNVNNPSPDGFEEGIPRDERRPFFAGPIDGFGGPFGWTQSIDYLCDCADNRYDSLQVKLTRRFTRGYSLQAHYTWQRVRQDGSEGLFFFPQYRAVSRGRPEWDRVHNVSVSSLWALPGGWQINTTAIVQSGLPFSVTYAGAGADRDTGPNRPDLTGDPRVGSGDGIDSPYFDVTPLGSPGSAFSRPTPGTFGNSGRNVFTGPGYWRVDGSLFKTIALGKRRALELRVEAVNLFNHVNLGNPDSEIGSPVNPRDSAGFINSTAYFGNDPQRNLQFGVRLLF
jgi:outer membrane receptor protein involved in Fe transport